MFSIERVDHVALGVADPERSIAWYREHLGFERRFADLWDGPPFMIGAGDAVLALFPRERDADRPETSASSASRAGGLLHVALRLRRPDYEQARARLADAGIALRDVVHQNAWSTYFRDPDGYQLELTTYEPPAG